MAPKKQKRKRRKRRLVKFNSEVDLILLDNFAYEDEPTMLLLKSAKKENRWGKELMRETDTPIVYSEYAEYINHFNNENLTYKHYRRGFNESIYDYFVSRLSSFAGDTSARLKKLKSIFLKYADIYELIYRMSSLEYTKIYKQGISYGDFETLEFILKTFEEEWKWIERKPETQTGRRWQVKRGIHFNDATYEEILLGFYKDLLKNGDKYHTPLEGPELKEAALFNTDQMLAFSGDFEIIYEKWQFFRDFFDAPFKHLEEIQGIWVESYFSCLDTALFRSMINNFHDQKDNEPIAEKLIKWKVSESLLARKPERKGSPVMLADKALMCGRSNCRAACRKHQGILLLILIRLGHYDMVKLAIDNGMAVEHYSNIGNATNLTWVSRAVALDNFYFLEDEVEKKHHKGKSKKGRMPIGDFMKQARLDGMTGAESDDEIDLSAEYEPVTPLSRAVESAGYFNSTQIVELLLELDANPLNCADAAVRACTPAVSVLSEKRKIKGKRRSAQVKCLQLIYGHVHQHYKQVSDNHCTLSLLHQASVEGDWDAVAFLTTNIENAAETNGTKGPFAGLNPETFVMIIQVIDKLFDDGEKSRFVNYAPVLKGLNNLVDMFQLYLNQERFNMLYELMIKALEKDIPGDRTAILDVFKSSQMQHYFGIQVDDQKWNKRRIELYPLSKRKRKSLKLLKNRERRQSVRRKILTKNTGSLNIECLEELCVLAAKNNFVELLREILSTELAPSKDCILRIAAHALRNEDKATVQQLVYLNFYHTKPEDDFDHTIVDMALKNGFFKSLYVLFDVLDLEVELEQRIVDTLEEKVAEILFLPSNQQGQDHIEVQHLENSFRDILKHLFQYATEERIKLILSGIVHRCFKDKVKFLDLHQMLLTMVQKKKLLFVTEEFVEVYIKAYVSWITDGGGLNDSVNYDYFEKTLEKLFLVYHDVEVISLLEAGYRAAQGLVDFDDFSDDQMDDIDFGFGNIDSTDSNSGEQQLYKVENLSSEHSEML